MVNDDTRYSETMIEMWQIGTLLETNKITAYLYPCKIVDSSGNRNKGGHERQTRDKAGITRQPLIIAGLLIRVVMQL